MTTCLASSQEIGTDARHLRTTSGNFEGMELDWFTLERQMIEHWSRDQIKTAIENTRKTWFDYRMLHPVLRSHLFWHEYNRGRARAMQKFYGRKRRFSEHSLYSLKKQTRSMVINTMLIVDELRMPYAIFFDAINEYLMQKAGYTSGWNRDGWGDKAPVPIISHMRHAEGIIAAEQAFEELTRTKLPLPKHPTFQAGSWAATHDQAECVAWLCAQAKRREKNMPYALYHLVQLGYLHEREILRRFGPDMVSTVRAIVV